MMSLTHREIVLLIHGNFSYRRGAWTPKTLEAAITQAKNYSKPSTSGIWKGCTITIWIEHQTGNDELLATVKNPRTPRLVPY